MPDKRASVIWLDFNGVTRQTILSSLTGAGAVWAAVQACSRAQVLTSWESPLGATVGAAANASYQSVKVSAQLTFQTASGSLLRLTVPAPLLTIMLADGQTVNPADPLVAAVIAAAVGTLTDGSGNAAVSYVSGILQPTRNDLPPVI